MTTAEAQERYGIRWANCKGLLAMIGQLVDSHTPEGYEVHWGHVGDLAHVEAELQGIHDFLHQGEKARRPFD